MAVQLSRELDGCVAPMSVRMIGDQDGLHCASNCRAQGTMSGPRAGKLINLSLRYTAWLCESATIVKYLTYAMRLPLSYDCPEDRVYCYDDPH